MDREEMQTKIEEYKSLLKQMYGDKTKFDEMLAIDRHAMFMCGLYALNVMGMGRDVLADDLQMGVLRDLCAVHLDLAIQKLQPMLTEETSDPQGGDHA